MQAFGVYRWFENYRELVESFINPQDAQRFRDMLENLTSGGKYSVGPINVFESLDAAIAKYAQIGIEFKEGVPSE